MAAAIVTVLATSSDSVKGLFFLSTSRADQIIGLAGLIVLLLSILELKVAWRERSSRHAEAASSLSRLKLLIARELGSDLVLTKARYMEQMGLADMIDFPSLKAGRDFAIAF
jgi:hypothetical protein